MDDLRGRGVLQQESVGAGPQRAHDMLVGLECGQDDHVRRSRKAAVKSRLRVVHENRDVHSVCDCELGEKARDVRLDGGLAHEQGCRNLGI